MRASRIGSISAPYKLNPLTTRRQSPQILTMFLQVGGPAYRGDLRYYLKTMSRDYPGRYAHFIAPGPKHTALYRRESLLLDASYLPFDMELGGYSDTVVDGLSLGQWVSDMLSGSESWKPTPAE